jgi:branched-chain amino acid transport system permease protein
MNEYIDILFSDYSIHLAIYIGIYLILSQSLNLTFGLGQLFNLAHVASYAIGAYTTALLSTEAEASFFTCVIASMTLSGIFSVLLGGIALRLSSDYFSIGTLAFSAVVSALLINWKSLTHGVLGIPGIPRPELAGVDFYQNGPFLGLLLLFVASSQLFFYVLMHGRFGRSLRALAEYEQAAAVLGKDTRTLRNLAFLVSSSAAGLAGGFFAYYLNYIDPSSFSLNEMIFILTIVIVGRPGSFGGIIASTAFLILLPEPLRSVGLPSMYLGPTRQLMYAAILFGVVWWKRESLFPKQRKV